MVHSVTAYTSASSSSTSTAYPTSSTSNERNDEETLPQEVAVETNSSMTESSQRLNARLHNLLEKARGGDPDDLYNLGKVCEMTGKDFDGDVLASKYYKTAATYYRKAAAASNDQHVNSQYRLGKIYQEGKAGVKKDSAKAFECFLKAAHLNLPEAQYEVGNAYEYAKGVEKSTKHAEDWYKRAAEKGSRVAMLALGQLCEKGQGHRDKKDLVQAYSWYGKAAALGSKTALEKLVQGTSKEIERRYASFYLGKCYETGQGVEQNFARAYELYQVAALRGHSEALERIEIAAEQENPDAQYAHAVCLMGRRYYTSPDKAEKDKRAVPWIMRAAENGHIRAMLDLGDRYAHGQGVQQSMDLAVKWWQKAADKGNSKAQLRMGNQCEKRQDYREAAEWYQKAANQENVDAQIRLAHLLEDGIKGVEKNVAQALEWFCKAAVQGDVKALRALKHAAIDRRDPNGAFLLGTYFEKMKMMEIDLPQAYTWYKKAAILGHLGALDRLKKEAEEGIPLAQVQLGLLHEHGQVLPQSYAIAKEWYEKAAEKNLAVAKTLLGVLYEYGRGVRPNDKRAASLYREAALLGDRNAQFCLGFFYEEGRGFPQNTRLSDNNYDKAERQNLKKNARKQDRELKKAALQGDRDAQTTIGGYYYHGHEDFQPNPEQGIEWWRSAAELGQPEAQRLLGNVYMAEAYMEGRFVEPNKEIARYWYGESAQQGNREAARSLEALTNVETGAATSST